MASFIEVGYVFQGTAAQVAAYTPTSIDAGLFVRDTENNIDYWIDPDGLGLILRKSSGYSGFSLTDGTNTGTNVADGASAGILGGTFLKTSVTGTDLTIEMDSIGVGQGFVLVSDGAGAFISRPSILIDPGSTNFLDFNAATGILSATPTLIQSWTDATEANLAAFIAANYTVGDEYQVGDVIRTTDGAIYMHNGGAAGDATDFTQVNNGLGAISSFLIAADSGTANSITDAETLTFIGGANTSTTVGANSVTIDVSLALADISDVPVNPGAGDFALINNNGTISYQLITDTHLGNTDLATDANRTYTLTGTDTLTFQLGATNTAVFSAAGFVMNNANIEYLNSANGQIKVSPDGTRWIETINNNGQTTWTSL